MCAPSWQDCPPLEGILTCACRFRPHQKTHLPFPLVGVYFLLLFICRLEGLSDHVRWVGVMLSTYPHLSKAGLEYTVMAHNCRQLSR